VTVILCELDELPEDGARGFDLPQTRLLAVRDRGGVQVFLNRCPHLGTPLQWEGQRFLDNEGHFIRCATHGALFEKTTGLCIQGPCRGEHLWQIDCRIENGNVVIDENELPAAPAIFG
jgi:nitrite reductase/ring-hydroxylating ferredoxin subunit